MGVREMGMNVRPASRLRSGKAQNMLKVHETVGRPVCAKVFISGRGARLSYYRSE